MKTLSNAELQEAILKAHWLAMNSTSEMSNKAHAHYDMLLDEQMKRATERSKIEVSGSFDMAEFDARFRAQDGPEWVDNDFKNEMPVNRNATVEFQFINGECHGGCAKNFVWTDINDETNIEKYRIWSESP